MQHEMQVMDPTGHTTVKWNPSEEEEVKVARDTFNTMRDRGYRAFRIKEGDEKGERMTSFDPKAEQMILIPHLVGG